AAQAADRHAVSPGIGPAHAIQRKAAAGLARQNAAVFVPLIAQAGARGRNTEARAGARAIGQTRRRAGNCDVLIDRQAGTVGLGTPASAADYYAVGGRIAGTHIVQSQ